MILIYMQVTCQVNDTEWNKSKWWENSKTVAGKRPIHAADTGEGKYKQENQW